MTVMMIINMIKNDDDDIFEVVITTKVLKMYLGPGSLSN